MCGVLEQLCVCVCAVVFGGVFFFFLVIVNGLCFRSGRGDRMGRAESKDHDYRDVDYRGYSHDGGYNESDGLSKDRQHGRGDFEESRFRARGNRESGDRRRRGSGFSNSHAHFEHEERDFRFEDEHGVQGRDYERYRRRSEDWRRDGGQAEEEKYSRSASSRRVGRIIIIIQKKSG